LMKHKFAGRKRKEEHFKFFFLGKKDTRVFIFSVCFDDM